MVQKRSIGLAIFLSIITLGIYGIYWEIVLTNETAKLSGNPSFSGGKSFLFSLITCGIYTFFWVYQLGKEIAKAQENKGVTSKDNGVIYLILTIFGFGIVAFAIAQSDVNSLVD